MLWPFGSFLYMHSLKMSIRLVCIHSKWDKNPTELPPQPFMVTLPGNTEFLWKFSPITPLFCCALLQLRFTLRGYLQKKTNMGHLPWCKLFSPSFNSLSQSSCFWLILSLHVLYFCILSITFVVSAEREAVEGLLHLGQNWKLVFHL